MKSISTLFIIIFLCFSVHLFAQKNITPSSISTGDFLKDSVAKNPERDAKKGLHKKKIILSADTLTPNDYMMCIEHINDKLNNYSDSVKLGFDLVNIGRRVAEIKADIARIRQNVKEKHSVVNIKNLYLYKNYTIGLDEENNKLELTLNGMYKRVYYAKQHLRKILSDTLFHRIYTDSILRIEYEEKLNRIEHKWTRVDSVAKVGLDSIGGIKIKSVDNSITLANMIFRMDNKLDNIEWQLFGQETNFLWNGNSTKESGDMNKTIHIVDSEIKAFSYYMKQTDPEFAIIGIIAILLAIWVIRKRKLLKLLKADDSQFKYLNIKFIANSPIFALLVLVLAIMPLFEAYAPIFFTSLGYLLLFISVTIVFIRSKRIDFVKNWQILGFLYVAAIVLYLFIVPSLLFRIILLALEFAMIVASVILYKKWNRDSANFKIIRIALWIGLAILALGILGNIFGRFSLSVIFGIAGIYAVTHAIIMLLFIELLMEMVLIHIQDSRLSKGVNTPFDTALVIKQIKKVLIFIAVIIWTVMLASNLNIYGAISREVLGFFNTTREVGNISFRLSSVIMFFVIIWISHILQRILSFLFGETGDEAEDNSATSKGHHSRLLITRLLVLIGGYLLAIVVSGLPIDKLTFLIGALGVGVGMGLQNVVNNFVSGIILIFDGSLKIGDEIEVGGQAGKVKEIGLRASTLSTSDGAEVIIPNGNILSQNIVNWTFTNNEKRTQIDFSLTGSELDANMINDVINETLAGINGVKTEVRPSIIYTKVAQGSCSLTVRFWTSISKADNVKSTAIFKLHDAFAKVSLEFH